MLPAFGMRRPAPQLLRSIAWLALGLILWASTPHVHLGETHAGPRGEPEAIHGVTDALPPLGPTIAPDVHHEEHSAQLASETHPCGLCRSVEDHPIDRPRAGAIVPETDPARLPHRIAENLHARLFASLHPARGPPDFAAL